MKDKITTIILERRGADEEIDYDFWLSQLNQEGKAYQQGFNQALSDIRAKAPDMAEGIIEKFREDSITLFEKWKEMATLNQDLIWKNEFQEQINQLKQ